jgi:hypothetical protein
MWTAIILDIVVIIVGKFLYDINRQSAQITEEGGMINKYRDLIEFLKDRDPNSRIFQETSDSVTIGASDKNGTLFFMLIQTFGNVTVIWKTHSSTFGKYKMKWEFPENENQNKMAERITYDLEKYQQNLMSVHGSSVAL